MFFVKDKASLESVGEFQIMSVLVHSSLREVMIFRGSWKTGMH